MMFIKQNPKFFLLICLLSINAFVLSTYSQMAEPLPSPSVESTLSDTEDASDRKEILVDNFDEGETEGVYYNRKNSLDYYQGSWSKRPSYTLLSKSEIYLLF